ncbi:MAG: FMN-binding negative transcriptional regulator, partial [Planctomycetia bacterium]|nr:FMN-binding negative transcriptional regulator [Planctomycetia bacterium]
ERHSFGLLVSQVEGEPFISHLPFLLDRAWGPHGRLTGHLALTNPQWRQADGQPVLAVFTGPHAYISPTWYEAEHTVPTWNYVAVHVYGTLWVVQDEEALAAILQEFVAFYEANFPRPWRFEPSTDFSRKLIQAVAGFHIEISRVEGKFKLNQNRPPEQRARVVQQLRALADENSQALADLMSGGS